MTATVTAAFGADLPEGLQERTGPELRYQPPIRKPSGSSRSS
ncbi:hypothetical protein ABZY81_34400 [Streptomyces sp. NPDC006514]